MPKSRSDTRSTWLWRLLTSIRLTIFLLLILAVLAVAGTVRFPGIYYTAWFLAPLGVLALNLLACLVAGLPQAVAKAARPFTAEQALILPERGRFVWAPDVKAAALASEALRGELGRPRHKIMDDKEVFFYSRGRLRPLGPYLVHLSLVLILVGGAAGKFWGITGRMLLQPELPVDSFKVAERKTVPLDFQVELNRFQVRYYENGSGTPKEFRSDLTFYQDGAAKAKAVCRVNDPVTFGGYTFYQSSYGAVPPGPIQLKVSRGDKQDVLELPLRRWVRLPDGEDRFMLLGVEANLQGRGPAVQLAYSSGTGHPRFFRLLQNQPEWTEPRGSFRLTLGPLSFKYYSILQVKYDPGVWWVYAGFILLLGGMYLAFFRPSQRWAVVLQRGEGGRCQGLLLGAGPRGKEAFELHTERLLARLQRGAS